MATKGFFAQNIGQVVKTPLASFNKEALKSCQIKCNLAFVSSSGESFTAVFFKAAYEQTLLSKSQVKVVGKVQANSSGTGYIIFVQGIE